jgi:putative pantetheine hydrolase
MSATPPWRERGPADLAGPVSGPTNTLVDVAGLSVGHATRTDSGWLSGVTVVVAPDDGAVASVDVSGGAPGTRETDLLRPGSLVERVHAIVLTGGSAYGLAAAAGVADALGEAGIGLHVGPSSADVVPIVPAAVLFDLGRGGNFNSRPGPAEGRAALEAASTEPVVQGCVGAGTGARAGVLKGGVGSASQMVGGWTVGALVVVNAAGDPVSPRGALYGIEDGIGDEFDSAPVVDPAALRALRDPATPRLNTTLAVVGTDAALDKSQCQRMAVVGQDGIARAIRPAHLLVDGDTVFTMATARGNAPATPQQYDSILAAAASCVSRAIAYAMLAATSTPSLPAFRDLAS